jgi:hypothetical protein
MAINFTRAGKTISRERFLEMLQAEGITPNSVIKSIASFFNSADPRERQWAITFISSNLLNLKGAKKSSEPATTEPDSDDPLADLQGQGKDGEDSDGQVH